MVLFCCYGCSSGPSFHNDSSYRSIERERQQGETELAVIGSSIAAEVDQIDHQAGRIVEKLSGVEAEITGSSLEDVEKIPLLRQVAEVQKESLILGEQVNNLRTDTELLNIQLAHQREINTALSAEHDRREAASAEVKEELSTTRENLKKVSSQRNIASVLAIVLAMVIIGAIVIRMFRF